jgi:hypothetical protein
VKSQAARWAAVVYGRTRAADSWWQAAPHGSSTAGWLAQFVYAAFAGGRGLDACPRFLVAQDSRRRIIGVACQAHELSGQMYSDGQRELSCFVGWVADRSAVAESSDLAGPALEELRQQYAHWAAPVYQEIMTPVWDLPHSPFRRPAVTVPAAPPWDEQDGGVEYDLSERVPHPGEGLWPAGTWPALWAAALATTGSFTCVVGWPYARSARRDGVTHLGVADAPERGEPLVPARIVRAPAPKPSDAPEPVSDPAVLGEPQPALAEDSASMADGTLTMDHGFKRAVPTRRLHVQAHWPFVDSRRVAITHTSATLRQTAVACLSEILTRKAPSRLLAMSRRARIGAGAALALGVILIMVLVITSTWL